VNATLTLALQSDAIVIPSQAVQTGQQGQYVFVVAPDSTAEYRLVTLARTVAGEAVVEKGINPGERVVTDGQLRLTQGAQVTILDAAQGASGDKPQ
jgi:multidrug efflux system membrane fusion protein